MHGQGARSTSLTSLLSAPRGRTPLTGLSSPVQPAEEEVAAGLFRFATAETTDTGEQPVDPVAL